MIDASRYAPSAKAQDAQWAYVGRTIPVSQYLSETKF